MAARPRHGKILAPVKNNSRALPCPATQSNNTQNFTPAYLKGSDENTFIASVWLFSTTWFKVAVKLRC